MVTDIGEFFTSGQGVNDSMVLLMVIMAFYNEDIVVFINFIFLWEIQRTS